MPWIIQGIETNGVQVKVFLVTLERTHIEEIEVPRSFRAKGVDALQLAGYHALSQELDIERDFHGIFGSLRDVDEIPNNLIITGIDPGQKEIMTVSEEHYSHNAFRLPDHERTSFLSITSEKYRHDILAANAERKNAQRRINEEEYAAMMDFLSSGSWKDPHGVEAYTLAFHNSFDTKVDLTMRNGNDGRRQEFARFRANQRTFARIGMRTVHHRHLRALRKRNLKKKAYRKAKRAMKEAEKLVLRIIAFGKPTFGHGIYGPCPRKKTIRTLAKYAAVLLVDEFRTTKMCFACHSVTIPSGYRMRRCTNFHCGRLTDRDINACLNIAQIVCYMLKFGERPPYLRRNRRNRAL